MIKNWGRADRISKNVYDSAGRLIETWDGVGTALGSGCAGGAVDEVVTDYDYGPDSGPNNLLLRGVAVTADGGSGLVARRTCYGYDTSGNRISETSPKANPASCP